MSLKPGPGVTTEGLATAFDILAIPSWRRQIEEYRRNPSVLKTIRSRFARYDDTVLVKSAEALVASRTQLDPWKDNLAALLGDLGDTLAKTMMEQERPWDFDPEKTAADCQKRLEKLTISKPITEWNWTDEDQLRRQIKLGCPPGAIKRQLAAAKTEADIDQIVREYLPTFIKVRRGWGVGRSGRG